MNNNQEPPWNNPRFRNWVTTARACQAVGRAITQALAPLDLKAAHLDMMMNIHRHPGSSQQDVAKKLLVGRSNITMLIPQLEKRGLVERKADAKDRRIMRLFLTEQGEGLLGRALDIYLPLIDRLLSGSTEEDCDTVGRSMQSLIDIMEAEPE